MSGKEFNYAFMALLLAGIVAVAAGLVAGFAVSPRQLAENAYPIDTGAEEEAEMAAVETAPEEDIAALLASADPDAGARLSRACAACHSFDEGGANRVGPTLWGVVDRDIAGVEGFKYSGTLAGLDGGWTVDALNGFLAAPRDWAPGTIMSYAGMRSAEDRADLIAWLNGLGGTPAPAPAATPSPAAAPAPAAATPPAAEATAPAAAAASDVATLLASADPTAGQRVSRACGACHTFDQGGANRIGPNLWNVVNRDIAGIEGFRYSGTLAGLDGAWTYDSLDSFLAAPKQWAPGTSMSFAGIRKAEDRASLIAWLRSLSDDPAPLP
ncbi:MAG: c-type cytochrome [Inquilinus sp.]|nr:c-type cytochrome [Inquilinus sp.]